MVARANAIVELIKRLCQIQNGLILVAQTDLKWKVRLVHVDKILAAVWIQIYQLLIYKLQQNQWCNFKFLEPSPPPLSLEHVR